MTQDHNNTIASFCSDGPQQLMESGLGKPSEIKLGTVTTTPGGGGEEEKGNSGIICGHGTTGLTTTD